MQSVIFGIARDISELQKDLLSLEENKLSVKQFESAKAEFNERVDDVDAKLVFLESQINRLVLYDEKSENLSIAPVNALYDAQTEELSLLANAEHDESGESLTI